MKMNDAIDLFMADMRLEGRINSPATEKRYFHALWAHSEDVSNRSPHVTNRDDVKRTLRRWPVANTQRTSRSILVSFYRWAVEEGIRPNNPAEQTRRPKRTATSVYRLTKDEAARMMASAEGVVETRAIRLALLAGLRSAELRGLTGRHFRREGFVQVSADIAKGNRARYIPVLPELLDTWHEIRRNVAEDEYVLPAQRWRDPGRNKQQVSLKQRPMSAQGLYYMVIRVGERAKVSERVHPHLLRHAYGDHIAKHAGLLVAQAMLGHASVATTRDTYVGNVSLDDLAESVAGFMLGYPVDEAMKTAVKATTGIEPVEDPAQMPAGWMDLLESKVALYLPRFSGGV